MNRRIKINFFPYWAWISWWVNPWNACMKMKSIGMRSGKSSNPFFLRDLSLLYCVSIYIYIYGNNEGVRTLTILKNNAVPTPSLTSTTTRGRPCKALKSYLHMGNKRERHSLKAANSKRAIVICYFRREINPSVPRILTTRYKKTLLFVTFFLSTQCVFGPSKYVLFLFLYYDFLIIVYYYYSLFLYRL